MTGNGEKFDRFTEEVRRVLALAQLEARRFGDRAIEPEHLLLALAAESSGVGARALDQMGVDRFRVHALTLARLSSRENPVAAPSDLAAVTQRVISLAVEEARQMGHDWIGT